MIYIYYIYIYIYIYIIYNIYIYIYIYIIYIYIYIYNIYIYIYIYIYILYNANHSWWKTFSYNVLVGITGKHSWFYKFHWKSFAVARTNLRKPQKSPPDIIQYVHVCMYIIICSSNYIDAHAVYK